MDHFAWRERENGVLVSTNLKNKQNKTGLASSFAMTNNEIKSDILRIEVQQAKCTKEAVKKEQKERIPLAQLL
jgi:hypothetical protein